VVSGLPKRQIPPPLVEILLRTEKLARALRRDGERFILKYSDDPRQWQVLGWMYDYPPAFLTGIRPVADETDILALRKAMIPDPEGAGRGPRADARPRGPRGGATRFAAEGRELVAVVAAGITLHENFRRIESASRSTLRRSGLWPRRISRWCPICRAHDRGKRGSPGSRRRSARCMARNAAACCTPNVLKDYFYQLEQLDPVAVAEEVKPFLASQDEYVRNTRGQAAQRGGATAPVDLAFTAMDGRTVDFKGNGAARWCCSISGPRGAARASAKCRT